MTSSYFELIDETPVGGRYLAGPLTSGPWAEHLQHGGPPNALAVAAAERVVQAESGRDDLVALRQAADFVGPVPVAEIATRARVLRSARSAVLAEVSLSAGGRECLHTRVWFVRAVDTSGLVDPLPNLDVADVAPGLDVDFGYGASLEWRVVRGGLRQRGPGAVWVRPRVSLVEGHVLSGLARAVLVGDSASGISAELDWAEWSFLNVDLDVHLARPPEGEWIFMDAVTQLGPRGSALARSTLSDVHGVAGSTLQTLVLTPLRR